MRLSTKNKDLNDKQQRFVDAYVVDLNATQAAITAGYSKKTAHVQGSRLLKNVKVKKAIDEQNQVVRNEYIADAQEVSQFITEVMRGNIKEQVAIYTGSGTQEIYDKDVPVRDRLRAAELLGKRYNLFTDNNAGENTDRIIIVDSTAEMKKYIQEHGGDG